MIRGWMTGLIIVSTWMATGCSIFSEKFNQNHSAKHMNTPVVSPSIDIANEYYSGILPYMPNQSRGTLSGIPSRIDASHLEWGLLELAKTVFAPSKYLFQEGQVIKRKDIENWLNEHPPLIHVLEHDYLNISNAARGGIVIGLSLSPVYKDDQGNRVLYSDQEMRAQGEQIAARILATVREREPKLPVLMALFRTEPDFALIPGRFLSRVIIEAEQSAFTAWDPIDERYFLLPGDDLREMNPEFVLQFSSYQQKLQSFFKDYVGIVGLARTIDQQIIELTLTASAQYDSRTEVIQFTQFAASLIPEHFDKNIHINLYVNAVDRPLAIYIRPVDADPIFHVYRN